MELCPESLRDWIARRNEENTTVNNRHQLYSYFRMVCTGLKYIHEFDNLGMIHRDLKPGNILLTENGIAKIADFGTATLSPFDTHTTGPIGTWIYKPREQDTTKNYTKARIIFSYVCRVAAR